MMKKPFPILFFGSIFSVERIFSIRYKAHWAQLVLIFVFIQSLLLIPLSFGLLQSKDLAVDILPLEFVATESIANEIKQLPILKGRLNTEQTSLLKEETTFFVGTNLSVEQPKDKMGMNFEQEFVELVIEGTQKFQKIRLFYTPSFVERVRDGSIYEALQAEIYQQNKASIFFAQVVNIGSILFSMNAMLIIGVSLLFYLTKKTSAIQTFKASVTLALALMSGGVFLATGMGFLTTNIFILFGIQSLWLVGMTILLFVKTRFRQVTVFS